MCVVNINVLNVWFRYTKQQYILKNAIANFTSGGIYGVIGEIGSGKTTLMYLLAGLLEPEKGRITINSIPAHKYPRDNIGFVFQNPDDQIFNLYVKDEIGYTVKQINEEKFEEAILDVAEKLNIVQLLDRKTRHLSFGQKKLVTIASALVHDPRIVLMDEPFANLSRKYVEIVKDLIRDLSAEGKLIILTSHDLNLISNVINDCYEIVGGRLQKTIRERTIF